VEENAPITHENCIQKTRLCINERCVEKRSWNLDIKNFRGKEDHVHLYLQYYFLRKKKHSAKWKHEAGNDDGKQKERKRFLQKRKKENNMHSEMNLELRYVDNYNGKRWKFQL